MPSDKDRKIIQEARERYRIARDAWSENFRRFDEGMRFHTGQQFTDEEQAARGLDRPLLPFNVLRSKINALVNAFRNNRPGVRVTPTDSTNLDSAGAEIHEGLCRATDYASNSETAYDTAFKFAAAGGISFFGLSFDYASPESFVQTVQVRCFPDPRAVLIDPASQDPNGIDMTYAFVLSKLPIAVYERKYGKSELAKNGFLCGGIDSNEWVNEYEVQVVEYWTVERKSRILVAVDDGEAMFADDPRFDQYLQSRTDLHELADPETGELDITAVFQTREVDFPHVKHRILNAIEILEENDFPTSMGIPIFLCTANDDIVEGKRVISGILADAMLPQQMLSYVESQIREVFSLIPIPRWVAEEGSVEGYVDDYTASNLSKTKLLLYKGTNLSNQPAQRPHWETYSPNTAEFSVAAARYRDYIKECIGTYSSQLGDIDPKAHSGTAIRALQTAGANATSHIASNFNRALAHRYKMECDMNSKLLSVGQQVRILGPDEKAKIQMVNDNFFSTKIDVTVNTGPSFQSQEEFRQQTLLGLAQSDPQGFSVIRDLAIRAMRLGNIGDQIAKRWTPPQFADGNEQIPPQVQQQMQHLNQVAQGQAQELQRLQQVVQTKQIEAQSEAAIETMKFEHAKELALISQQTQLLIADQKNDTTKALGELEAQLEYIRTQVQTVHEERLLEKKHDHSFALDSAHRAADEHDRHQQWGRDDEQTMPVEALPEAA